MRNNGSSSSSSSSSDPTPPPSTTTSSSSVSEEHVGSFNGGHIDVVGFGTDFNDAASILQHINQIYLGAAVIHFLNAFQYAWAWLPSGFRWYSVVMIPEYLNMLGAGIYIYTASKYPECIEYESDVTTTVHRAETFASSVELIAAFGWCITWFLTFPRGIPGRGFTLDDPDVWGNIFIVAPSIIYVQYNAHILHEPTAYGSDLLYERGDLLFAIGAFFYLFSSLRDDGWFFWMPTAGAIGGGWDVRTPIPPPNDVRKRAFSNPNTCDTVMGGCFGCACDCCEAYSEEGDALIGSNDEPFKR